MERRAVAPPQPEITKSFDVLASVKLYRYDLETFGEIRPETQQRVYDEELTYIAEGINRPVYTEFSLRRDEDELVFFHNGQWQPYIGSLLKAVSTYQAEAVTDRRKVFMADRAADELVIGYKLKQLQPGEKLKWYSDFPGAEAALFGEEFVQQLGFQPARFMGFLYEAEGSEDGSVLLRSQSVDNSDAEAFYAAMEQDGLDAMMAAYDSVLARKFDGDFVAGRRVEDRVPEENAWDIVRQHKDLIDNYFLVRIRQLSQQNLSDAELEKAKKQLTYGVWAAIKQRLDTHILPKTSYEGSDYSVQAEVDSAYQVLAARGEVLFGCGGAIEAILEASPEEVFNSIFGVRERMSCPFCGATQYGDPCSPNQYCPSCTAQIVNGEVVSRGNTEGRVGVIDEFVISIQVLGMEVKLNRLTKERTIATDDKTRRRLEREIDYEQAQLDRLRPV